jgi:hypothetical protein
MSTKKIVLITIGSVFGLILVGILAIVTIRVVVNQSVNGAKMDDNKITSAYFEVTVPEGSVLTNEDKINNNIYVTVPTEYGELRVSITRQSYEVAHSSTRGTVVSEEVVVDGTKAIQKTIDYSNIIKGTSEKLLIRYEIAIDKITQPSEEEYTKVGVTAMSKDNLTSAEEKDVEEKADAIIQSLVIK